MSLGIQTATQVVYVDIDGSDTNGNGSYNSPYATVGHAMAAITDSSTTKRYLIAMGPLLDTSDIVIKPYVWIQGSDIELSRLSGVLSLDPGWGVNVNQKAGFFNLSFNQATPTFDYGTVASNQGKLFFTTCKFNGKPIFNAYSLINQIVLQGCFMFNGHTQNGINLSTIGTGYQNGGLISLNNSTNIPALWTAMGGGTDGDVRCNYGGGGGPVEVQMCGFGIAGTLTLNGSNIVFTATDTPASVIIMGGAPAPVFGGSVVANTSDINIAGPYSVLATDYMLAIRRTAASAISINLPLIADVGNGRVIVLNDSGYNAAANNITVVRSGGDKINNVAGNYIINTNGAAVWLRSNANTSNWEIIASH